ncbi:MAG: CusA/CzcA family heavy metal efflux RND transporter [Spirochaetota bacterium]|nr:CusA/CzcA family heavy metal efflux RND transporter [Spirochaetota bacterium]
MWLHKIISKSSKNPLMVVIMILGLTFGGLWGLKSIPLDAIPDLSDVQVIIFTKWQGRSPNIVEDQITYPIVSSMLSAPNVKTVRGISLFGLSFVYIIFKDGTDIYWARSRILEYMNEATAKLPEGVVPTLGPDATGVGWGFEYALVDKTNRKDPGRLVELRSFQDWNLRYMLKSIPGVSDVASVGGFIKQYQVTLNPGTLLQYKIPIQKVIAAIRMSNNEVGGRVVEFNGREYMIRGKGYIRSIDDINKIVITSEKDGAPLLLENIAHVSIGPDIRRGVADLNGEGEVVGGIVIIRFGEDVLSVIDRVKKKINEYRDQGSLPGGVELVITYDRSNLIMKAIKTLTEKLVEESIIVSLVCFIFLFHFRSALVAIITLPLAIIISFLASHLIGISSNIMSLGGIAIAIGAMVDSAIVMVENAHKHLEHAPPNSNRETLIIDAAKEVGRPLFFALLIITISFLPIFSLEGEEGRLFKPLAFTKTFAMFFASFLSITLVPVLMLWLIRGKIMPEWKNPMNRLLMKLYNPIAKLTIHHRKTAIIIGFVLMLSTIPAYILLETEFMPPLNEGTIMYMPVTYIPGISIEEAKRLLIKMDKKFKKIPEVKWVFGKAGRAETPTDPAPLHMIETIIELKDKSEWRKGYDLGKIKRELKRAVKDFKGVYHYFDYPIKTRLDMLSTGLRAELGIKVFGDNPKLLEIIGLQIEKILKNIPGMTPSVERVAEGGTYIDFNIKRDNILQYGLTVGEVQNIIETAIGGKNIDNTIEGRERYPINVRYPRGLRDNIETLNRVLVPTPSGAQIFLSELADLEITKGPMMIRSEGGKFVTYITVGVDSARKGITTYVKEADELIKKEIKKLKKKIKGIESYEYVFSGQFQNWTRAKERLTLVIPITIFLIIVLLYFNIRSPQKITIVLMAVPFSLVGSFWLILALGYKLSVAVWVGIIALAGLDAETGVVMLLYLDLAYDKWKEEGKLNSIKDLEDSILEGAVKRIRPKIMTVSAILFGLLPVMWSDSTGSDVMKRIAAPMVGGVITSSILELLLYPSIYVLWKERSLKKSLKEITSHNAPTEKEIPVN